MFFFAIFEAFFEAFFPRFFPGFFPVFFRFFIAFFGPFFGVFLQCFFLCFLLLFLAFLKKKYQQPAKKKCVQRGSNPGLSEVCECFLRVCVCACVRSNHGHLELRIFPGVVLARRVAVAVGLAAF